MTCKRVLHGPSPRFTDNGNGTVTDNLTGLIWLKWACCFGWRTWNQALTDCSGLKDGDCGLSDGSSAGDWRLPNIMELQSLLDLAYYNPALSNAAGTGQWTTNDAFLAVQGSFYWSGATYPSTPTINAWALNFNLGDMRGPSTGETWVVWPVRGGQ